METKKTSSLDSLTNHSLLKGKGKENLWNPFNLLALAVRRDVLPLKKGVDKD